MSQRGHPTVVHDLTRHGGKGCELVRGGLGVLAGQATHERTLSDGREANEADTGHTGPGNVETGAATAATARGRQQLALQLGQLGFELTQMKGSRLVLLGLGHLKEQKSIIVSTCILAKILDMVSVTTNGRSARHTCAENTNVFHAVDLNVGSVQTYFGLDIFNLHSTLCQPRNQYNQTRDLLVARSDKPYLINRGRHDGQRLAARAR